MAFREGDQAYIIENNSRVTPVIIYERRGDFYILGLNDAVLALRENRLYKTRREAEEVLPKWVHAAARQKQQQAAKAKSYIPYDYMNYRSPYGI